MDVGYEQSVQHRTVIDATGRVLGAVEGLAIDTTTWKVSALRVKLDRSVADTIGEPRRVFRTAVIDVPVDCVAGVGDTIVLNRPVETFAGESHSDQPATP